MDLIKLLAELREYRAQIEEAIAAMEELARRRYGSRPRRKVSGRKPSRPRAKAKPSKRRAARSKSS
jgi:hypothetical protein